MVGEALKGGRLLAEVFQRRGLQVYPPPHPGQHMAPLPCFITAIRLGSPQAMEAFCRAVQSRSPVGSYVRPVPGATASRVPGQLFICRIIPAAWAGSRDAL